MQFIFSFIVENSDNRKKQNIKNNIGNKNNFTFVCKPEFIYDLALLHFHLEI